MESNRTIDDFVPEQINFNDYSPERISPAKAEKRQVWTGNDANKAASQPSQAQNTAQNQGQQQKAPDYHQIQLLYNYLSPNKKREGLGNFQLEGCEMETKFGIQSKPNQQGKLEHSMMVTFDLGDPEQAKFVSVMDNIYQSCAVFISREKGNIKLPHFNHTMPEACGFKNIIYRSTDPTTGEYIQGRSPSCFFKLFSRGKPPMTEQTLFTDPSGSIIDWKLLTGVEMKFIPLFHIKRIYIGPKISVQIDMISAIVTSIRARGTFTKQTATMDRLRANGNGIVDQVSAQLSKLSMDRQEKLLDTTSKYDNGNGEDAPTFNGIVPSTQRTPKVDPPKPETITMQDFINAAPIRTPDIPEIPNISMVKLS